MSRAPLFIQAIELNFDSIACKAIQLVSESLTRSSGHDKNLNDVKLSLISREFVFMATIFNSDVLTIEKNYVGILYIYYRA